ncbi:putative membrane protein YqiK [Arthrobacter sp. B2I5]|uniref:hypothetical protein n=1 Tax=Arthrobacter sp. B2I5 TaxID=3042266 RepID=UPI002785DDFC|nr:hypothetical protein [Arthrobacter sp. B2I5]MDQ0825418.1 putative membrane protein YqiK [Arthrobacter sp. B2I5]
MMAKLLVLNPITHNDKDYKVGDKFEGSEEVVASLIAAGALEDPDREKTVQESSELADAQAQAEKIVKDAEAKAADTAAAAEKVLADAQAQAEKIVKDAEAAAKKAPATQSDTKTK